MVYWFYSHWSWYMYIHKTSNRSPFAWMSLCYELEPDIYTHCIQWQVWQRKLVILSLKGHVFLKSKGFYACGFLGKNSNNIRFTMEWINPQTGKSLFKPNAKMTGYKFFSSLSRLIIAYLNWLACVKFDVVNLSKNCWNICIWSLVWLQSVNLWLEYLPWRFISALVVQNESQVKAIKTASDYLPEI